MHNRLIVPALCAAAFIYACGPWLRSASEASVAHAEPAAPTAAPVVERAPATTRHHGAGTVTTTLAVARRGDVVDLALQVVNSTPKRVELRFPDARTHDFAVVDAHGATVWRWSAGRMFTQTMQTHTLSSNDTLTIANEWNARGAHGTYTVIATLATERAPVVRQLTLALP